jgi:uncharacterized membrane protein
MPLRQIIFALIFGVVIAFAMRYMLGGELIIHLLVAIPAALFGGWYANTRKKDGI